MQQPPKSLKTSWKHLGADVQKVFNVQLHWTWKRLLQLNLPIVKFRISDSCEMLKKTEECTITSHMMSVSAGVSYNGKCASLRHTKNF